MVVDNMVHKNGQGSSRSHQDILNNPSSSPDSVDDGLQVRIDSFPTPVKGK